jgi:hypothetical protein
VGVEDLIAALGVVVWLAAGQGMTGFLRAARLPGLLPFGGRRVALVEDPLVLGSEPSFSSVGFLEDLPSLGVELFSQPPPHIHVVHEVDRLGALLSRLVWSLLMLWTSGRVVRWGDARL